VTVTRSMGLPGVTGSRLLPLLLVKRARKGALRNHDGGTISPQPQ